VNIPVVYEDQWFLAVDKPAGLLVIPTPKGESRTLTSILNEEAKLKGNPWRLHPCHRLDRQTSGLIIYAKGKSSQKSLMQEFKQRKIKKTYIAFVQGFVKQCQGQINYPIQGETALTNYKVLQRLGGFTVLEINPITGRTNQIRIHLKGIGHPILGETKYAFRKDFKIKAKRLFLHAKALSFRHPISGRLIEIEVPLPYAMQDFLEAPQ
jgi:23S rRNA pseudouridine1911/1915/1917 synthase